MRKALIFVVMVLATSSLTGCIQNKPDPEPSNTYVAPRDRLFPHNTPNPSAPGDLQSPPATPKNKEAFADPKKSIFKVITYGGYSGKVEFDGEYFPLPTPKANRTEWERPITIEAGKTYSPAVIPDSSTVWSLCVWYHNNAIKDYQIAPTGGCTATFVK